MSYLHRCFRHLTSQARTRVYEYSTAGETQRCSRLGGKVFWIRKLTAGRSCENAVLDAASRAVRAVDKGTQHPQFGRAARTVFGRLSGCKNGATRVVSPYRRSENGRNIVIDWMIGTNSHAGDLRVGESKAKDVGGFVGNTHRDRAVENVVATVTDESLSNFLLPCLGARASATPSRALRQS